MQISMSSRIRRGTVVTVVALAITVGPAFAGRLEFSEVLSFDIPGPAGIYIYAFHDIDHDGVPEILAGGEDYLWLYSSTADSILFVAPYRLYRAPSIVFADINRDSVADIAVAYGYQGSGISDNALVVNVYNGADLWLCQAYHFPTPVPSEWYEDPGAFIFQPGPGLTGFSAQDLDNDGYDELFVSYGYAAEVIDQVWRDSTFRIGGIARMFFSFPDSILWSRNEYLMSNPAFRYFDNQGILTADEIRYIEYSGPKPDYILSSEKAMLVTSGGIAPLDIRPPISSLAWQKPIVDWESAIDVKCLAFGQIDDSDSAPDMLVNYYYRYDDYVNDSYSEIDAHCLYRAVSASDYELVWYKPPPEFDTYAFLPQFPGSYFAEGQGRFYRISGSTGDIIDTVANTPAGTLKWDYPYGPGHPYLVSTSVDSNHVSIYKIMELTDADDEYQPLLPATLSLGKPYPNPFNAEQTIPVTITPGHELTVTVYNLLGQKVETLYEGRPSANTLTLTWHADNFASGIYFVRAIGGDDIAVVRSILLK